MRSNVDATCFVTSAYSKSAWRVRCELQFSEVFRRAHGQVELSTIILRWASVHDRDMSEYPMEQLADNNETQRASNEAKERQMRLQVWLDGLLAGGPPLAEAVKPWREGLPMYNGSAGTLAEDQRDVPVDDAMLIEESLMAACRRIRERREQAGEPPPDLCEEDHRKRLTEVLVEVQAGRDAGEESTPMHVVLGARYIEGVIDWDDYHSRM